MGCLHWDSCLATFGDSYRPLCALAENLNLQTPVRYQGTPYRTKSRYCGSTFRSVLRSWRSIYLHCRWHRSPRDPSTLCSTCSSPSTQILGIAREPCTHAARHTCTSASPSAAAFCRTCDSWSYLGRWCQDTRWQSSVHRPGFDWICTISPEQRSLRPSRCTSKRVRPQAPSRMACWLSLVRGPGQTWEVWQSVQSQSYYTHSYLWYAWPSNDVPSSLPPKSAPPSAFSADLVLLSNHSSFRHPWLFQRPLGPRLESHVGGSAAQATGFE